MPIPGINLGVGKMLAIQTATFNGVEMQTEGYLFGIVDDIYSTSDNIIVGDTFIFREQDAVQLKYGSTIYYYLDVKDIQDIIIPFAP